MKALKTLFLLNLLALNLSAAQMNDELKMEDNETIQCAHELCRKNLNQKSVDLLPIENHDQYPLQLPCGHICHFACLSREALIDSRCPQCYAEFTLPFLAASSVQELKKAYYLLYESLRNTPEEINQLKVQLAEQRALNQQIMHNLRNATHNLQAVIFRFNQQNRMLNQQMAQQQFPHSPRPPIYQCHAAPTNNQNRLNNSGSQQ